MKNNTFLIILILNIFLCLLALLDYSTKQKYNTSEEQPKIETKLEQPEETSYGE